MIFSEEIATFIDIVLISILIFFMMLDTTIILIIKTRKPLLENIYYDFHRRHGFLKITIVKLIAVVIIIYATLTHQPSSGALLAPIFVHAVYVTKLLIDFIRKDGKQKSIQLKTP